MSRQLKTRRNSKSVRSSNSLGAYRDNLSNKQVYSFSEDLTRKPELENNFRAKYFLNGSNNSMYNYYEWCYKNSPTNQGIIDKTVNYIQGKGLFVKGLNDELGAVKHFISAKDFKLMCNDYKKHGQCAVFVYWEYVTEIGKMKPVKIEYVSIKKVGLEIDGKGETKAYWYCFDWGKTGMFVPERYYKFDGSYKGDSDDSNTRDEKGIQTDLELLVIQRTSDEDFYTSVDYESALEYAELEGELKNWSINHVKNDFQGGTIVNANNGQPSPDVRKKIANEIRDNLTGTSNARKILISFNENKEQEFTFSNMPQAEVNEQYGRFDDTAETKLIKAHGIPPILAMGTREGGGLGSNSEEITEATKQYYLSKILPAREDILTGIREVLKAQGDDNYSNKIEDVEIRDFFNPFEVVPKTEEIIKTENQNE